MAGQGYASNNIVFGSGGLLLNQWSRDTLKMAIKGTYCEVEGNPRPMEKQPRTDLSKKSKKGLLRVQKVDTPIGICGSAVPVAVTGSRKHLRFFASVHAPASIPRVPG